MHEAFSGKPWWLVGLVGPQLGMGSGEQLPSLWALIMTETGTDVTLASQVVGEWGGVADNIFWNKKKIQLDVDTGTAMMCGAVIEFHALGRLSTSQEK